MASILQSLNKTVSAGVILTIVLLGIMVAAYDLSFDLDFWRTISRYLHVISGVMWIGLLYYFNFVQVPALAEAASDEGGPGGAGITKYVAPRALWWFRWGAVVTWLSGASYLLRIGQLGDAFMLGGGSGPGLVIGGGAWLGTIMLFNVWALIWPNQKKILGMVEATADEIAKARRVAFLASRTNPLLSIPMLMSMVGYSHGGFFI